MKTEKSSSNVQCKIDFSFIYLNKLFRTIFLANYIINFPSF